MKSALMAFLYLIMDNALSKFDSSGLNVLLVSGRFHGHGDLEFRNNHVHNGDQKKHIYLKNGQARLTRPNLPLRLTNKMHKTGPMNM